MHLTVNIIERKLVCTVADRQPVFIELTDVLLAEMVECCDRYHEVQMSEDAAALLTIGQTLFSLINTQPAETQLWLNAVGARRITILAESNPPAEQQLLLHLPWEILAVNNQFLAADTIPFEVTRRVGLPSPEPLQPRYKDLTLAFMAADPGLSSGLNYEAEERAIFTATKNYKNLNLLVEESGNLEELRYRLSEAGHCDVLHLSCHGSVDPERGFVLHLEDRHFGLQPATVHDFSQLRLHELFSTLFLSACHSANNQGRHSMMIDLARLGVANIVGWDGAVADEAATQFAAHFYRAVQTEASVPMACAIARQILLQKGYAHWHLGRCCLGTKGGTPLVARGKPKLRKRKGKPCHELMDRRNQRGVPVASRATFVGRRQQTKEALRAFAEQNYAGVLLYAIGGSGKSSLAARIADRLEPIFKTVVLYRNYQPFDVLQSLEDAMGETEGGIDFPKLIAQVQDRPENFKKILRDLLEGVFDQQRILLILDDLEQHVLEELSGDRKEAEVKPTYLATLTAIIEAFDEADTESCLLLTSRYKFRLRNHYGDDVAGRLKAVNVPDMTETELAMHWLALQQTAQVQREESEQDNLYLQRIFAASLGNPGLQYILLQPLLKGETAALDRALERINDYRATQPEQSDSPSVNQLDKYLQRIALEVYSKALSDTELQLMRLLTLFDFPVPEELLLQAGPKAGIADPVAALQRLDNFGLLNHWQGEDLDGHISCYGLAEKVVEPLGKEDKNYLARVCAPLLWLIWFKDFLEEYAVPETQTFKESIDFILTNHFPSKYKGELPLSGEIDQRRIAALHRLCIRNRLADWVKIGFDADNFINLLELSLSLHIFEKLRVSSAALEELSVFQFTELYKVFDEERRKFQELAKEYPQDIIRLMFNQFSGRGELLRQAYSLFLGELDEDTEKLLRDTDLTDQENRLKTALQLAKTNNERADAYDSYAYFLADQKKDYPAAEAMYERAVEADPKHANNLGNYANLLKNQKQDYPAAEAMYERAVETDPKHANNLGNYANFLKNQKHDNAAAEAMYDRAVEADPKDARNLGNYANFLADQKQDYAAAEAMYDRALEADPNHARNLGSYAIFLDAYKNDYAAAEKMYQRALETAPENANRLGNYARLLFIRGDKTKAVEMLERAEQHQENEEPDLAVELAFYRYAHCQPHAIIPLKKNMLDGVRCIGWNLADNVRRAEQDGHPNPALLAALAKVISDNEPIKTLEQFPEWSEQND